MKKAPTTLTTKVGQGDKNIKKKEMKPRSIDPKAPPKPTSRKAEKDMGL